MSIQTENRVILMKKETLAFQFMMIAQRSIQNPVKHPDEAFCENSQQLFCH